MKFVTAYVTCKNQKEAEKIGRTLVGQRLAGCVNIIPKIKSICWWKGKIAKESEALLLAKAPAKNRGKIVAAVKANHSYSVPCVNFLPVEIGNPDFGKWLEEETKK